MLAAAIFATVIVALAAHHFFVEVPRRRAFVEAAGRTGPHPTRLADVMGRLPGGVFLQPAFTWSRITPEGDVELGVHPLLVGLVGPKPEFRLDPSSERVERGRPLLRVGAGDRSLALRSPVSGRIVGRNDRPRGVDSWSGAVETDGAWLCRIRPDDLNRELSTWMVGQRAQEWTRRQYGRIRDHLQRAVATGAIGVAMADGGEIPFGVLAGMDPADWKELENLLAHA